MNRNDQSIHAIPVSRKMVLIGIALGVISWTADALVDSLLSDYPDLTHSLFAPSYSEVLIRLFVMLIVIGFSVYAGLVIERLRQSEERVRESEERYRNVVETARDVIYSLSTDGLMTSFNPAFERLTGWRAPQMLGKNFLELVHSDDASAAMEVFQSALSGRVPDTFELRIRARSGEYLTGEFTVTPQFKQGRVTGVLGIARDVTGRKRAELALEENEAKYRDLFENANDLIQSVAADGTFHYVNRAWREALGYSDEDAARLTLFDIIHPDFREHCMAVFRRLMTGEKIDNVEAVFVTKGGRPVIVEGNVNCSIVDGTPVATRGIFRDITEHRHATELIKNILESVDEGFTVINRDFRILSANKAYADKFKRLMPDLIGKHCYEISHLLTKPCYEAGEDCAVRYTFEHGAPHTAVHVHYDKDRNPVYIETKAYPLRDSLGKVVSAIEIHNDITDKKRLESQLRHAQKMEAVGTLAGGIAHDFNNILTAIIGYGTLLQMKMAGADPCRSYVDNILASTERAANLTHSLLAFSRKQAINLQPISLNTLVKRVDKLITRLIGEDIEVRILLCDGGTTIHADAGQMEQVLMNLVTNARDAMPRGGLLTIETGVFDLDNDFIRPHGYGSVGRYIQLAVTDTGMGMDDRTRERIFEPFFTTKEVGKGTGLGLAIVYGIVKQHGGYINVDSGSGRGTTFRLYLPLVAATVETVRPAEAPMPEDGHTTILMAEDDDSVRALTRAVLEGFGYDVLEAVDGEDALVKFAAHRDRIQLLLLDIIMPKKNGRMVFEEIKGTHPGVKALFTSGYTAEDLRQKGVIPDAFNFLAKPVSPRDLLKKVKELLDDGPARYCNHSV